MSDVTSDPGSLARFVMPGSWSRHLLTPRPHPNRLRSRPPYRPHPRKGTQPSRENPNEAIRTEAVEGPPVHSARARGVRRDLGPLHPGASCTIARLRTDERPVEPEPDIDNRGHREARDEQDHPSGIRQRHIVSEHLDHHGAWRCQRISLHDHVDGPCVKGCDDDIVEYGFVEYGFVDHDVLDDFTGHDDRAVGLGHS